MLEMPKQSLGNLTWRIMVSSFATLLYFVLNVLLNSLSLCVRLGFVVSGL